MSVKDVNSRPWKDKGKLRRERLEQEKRRQREASDTTVDELGPLASFLQNRPRKAERSK